MNRDMQTNVILVEKKKIVFYTFSYRRRPIYLSYNKRRHFLSILYIKKITPFDIFGLDLSSKNVLNFKYK